MSTAAIQGTLILSCLALPGLCTTMVTKSCPGFASRDENLPGSKLVRNETAAR